MGEWREKPLRLLTSKIGSGATPRGGSNNYKLTGLSLIRSQNVLDFQFTTDGLAFIDDEQAAELSNVVVEPNDVLLNITGDSVARCCLVPKSVLPARVNQHVAIIRSKPKDADHRFIYYALQANKEVLLTRSEIGATRRALTKGMIEDFPISTPSLPEQQAIAGVLSSLDDRIDLLHRQNKTLEALAETLFRQWFVEGATQQVPITEYVDFNPTRKLTKGTLAPYLDMAGVSTLTFNPSGWYERDFTSGTKFQNGDTLLARITPCLENGKSAFVTFLPDGQIGWGSTEFIVMRSKGSLDPFFTYALARNQEFRDYAEGCMAGSSGRQRVDVEHLKLFELSAISESAVLEFNQLIKGIPPKLHQNMLQIGTLEKLRDTLLPKLMSGEVRVAYE